MSKLKYSLSEEGKVTIITIGGSLDVETSPELHGKLTEVMKEGTKNVVISMGKLNFITSAGLGVLNSFNDGVTKSGGKVVLSSMNDKVAKIFKLLGFINLFEIHESDQKALKAF
jgi:anti-anti-sigma factor